MTGARRAWPDVAALVLVLLGGAIRVRQWAGGRSLWLDEAFLAASITTRGPVDLVTEPLEWSQSAPLGWLLAERGVVALAGSGERGLRLLPLLLGLAALPLAWALARRLLPPALVPLPVGLVAVSPSLVYYANELKPYSADVAVFLLLLWLASRRSLVALSAAGAVAVWLSTASLLALAGISTVLVLHALRTDGARGGLRTALVLAPWAVSGAVAALVVRGLQRNDLLVAYWQFSFPRGAADLPAWLVRTGEALAADPLRSATPGLVLALLVAGTVLLARRRGVETALLLAVLGVALAAAAASAYPFYGRLALWVVPLVAVLMTAALPGEVTRRTLPWLAVSGAALAVVAAPLVRDGAPLLLDRTENQELRPVLAQLADQRQPGDVVLVDRSARAAVAYYADRIDGLRPYRAIGFVPAEGPCDDRAVLGQAGVGRARTWLVFSHQSGAGVSRASRVEVPRRAEAVARVERVLEAPGAVALLLVPRPDPVDVAPDDPGRCLALLPLQD